MSLLLQIAKSAQQEYRTLAPAPAVFAVPQEDTPRTAVSCPVPRLPPPSWCPPSLTPRVALMLEAAIAGLLPSVPVPLRAGTTIINPNTWVCGAVRRLRHSQGKFGPAYRTHVYSDGAIIETELQTVACWWEENRAWN